MALRRALAQGVRSLAQKAAAAPAAAAAAVVEAPAARLAPSAASLARSFAAQAAPVAEVANGKVTQVRLGLPCAERRGEAAPAPARGPALALDRAAKGDSRRCRRAPHPRGRGIDAPRAGAARSSAPACARPTRPGSWGCRLGH
jgi:hypothetical protein